jgi:valyl-tRNA synthetase
LARQPVAYQEPTMELPKNYDANAVEDRWKNAWEQENLYAWDPTKSREETFVVDTPPPTVSGSLHVGHLFSYSHQDFIVRYQRMRGKNIFFPIGWDDNGLPTERRVQNLLNVKCDAHLAYDPDFKPSAAEGRPQAD